MTKQAKADKLNTGSLKDGWLIYDKLRRYRALQLHDNFHTRQVICEDDSASLLVYSQLSLV